MTRHRAFDYYVGAAAVYAVVAVVGSLVLAGPEEPAVLGPTTGLLVLLLALLFVAGRLIGLGRDAASRRARAQSEGVDCRHYDFGLLGNLTPNQAEVLGQQLLDAAAVARENAADESVGGDSER